jgi:hypothetical protein
MKEALITLGFILTFLGGFAYGSLNHYVDSIDHCTSYTQRGVRWTGYKAISEDYDRRCFWLEGQFPYRVKQGVER